MTPLERKLTRTLLNAILWADDKRFVGVNAPAWTKNANDLISSLLDVKLYPRRQENNMLPPRENGDGAGRKVDAPTCAPLGVALF